MPIAATVASAIVEFRARGAEYRREVRRTAESTGEIRRELARADRAIQSFNRRTGALVRRLGSIRTAAAAAASVAGFGALAKRIADSVATIEHMAGVAGQTAEQLQVLEFAASQVGVATRNTQIGMQRFNRRLGEARTGAGVLAPVLDRMGIALKNADGTFRSSNQVLRDFADGIQRLNDPGQQLLAAFRAFDSEGAKLVLALRGGSSGLDAMASEAKRLGLILDPELVQAAVKLSDEFDRFTTIVRRNFQRIVLEYAPNLISALEGLGTRIPALFDRLPSLIGSATRALRLFIATIVGARTAQLAAGGLRTYQLAIGRIGAQARATTIAVAGLNAALRISGGPAGLLITLGIGAASAAAALIGLKRVTDSVAQSFESFQSGLAARSLPQLEADLETVRTKMAEVSAAVQRLRAADSTQTARAERQFSQLVRTAGALEAEIAQRQRLVDVLGGPAGEVAQRNNLAQALAAVNAETQKLADNLQGVTAQERQIRSIFAALTIDEALDPSFQRAVVYLQLLQTTVADAAARNRDLAATTGQLVESADLILTPLQRAFVEPATANGANRLGGILERMRDTAAQLGSTFAAAFAAFVAGTRSARDAASALLQTIAQIATQSLVLSGLGGLGLNIPAFASGGLAPPGLKLVGERGPELIQTRDPVRVYSQRELAAALSSQNIAAAGGDGLTVVVNGVRDRFDIQRAVREEVARLAIGVDRFNRRPGPGRGLSGV